MFTNLSWTPDLVGYVVTCDSKNGYQRDMCSKEIGLRAQNMMIILDLKIKPVLGYLDGVLMSTKTFTSMINKIFI